MEIVDAGLPTAESIRERRDRLETRLRAAAEAGGHDPAALRIVAITKSWPVEVARAAVEAGLTLLGESRVQEAEPKVAALPNAEWHFVGRLQSNKARRAARLFSLIHSINGRLLENLSRDAQPDQRPIRVLLQMEMVDDTGTLQTPSELWWASMVDALRMPGSVSVVGLMTIARMGADTSEARATFAALRALRDRLEEATGLALPELSMGMSADAEAAAAEGATLVRIGTALFGTRA